MTRRTLKGLWAAWGELEVVLALGFPPSPCSSQLAYRGWPSPVYMPNWFLRKLGTIWVIDPKITSRKSFSLFCWKFVEICAIHFSSVSSFFKKNILPLSEAFFSEALSVELYWFFEQKPESIQKNALSYVFSGGASNALSDAMWRGEWIKLSGILEMVRKYLGDFFHKFTSIFFQINLIFYILSFFYSPTTKGARERIPGQQFET